MSKEFVPDPLPIPVQDVTWRVRPPDRSKEPPTTQFSSEELPEVDYTPPSEATPTQSPGS